jgi:4-nitrophenyl phosphatase
MLNLAAIRTLLLDMDGVLYRGSTALPGVNDLLALCERRGVAYACITNNATQTPEQYEEKLRGLGIPIPAERVVTSAMITNRYLRANYPRGTTIYAVGMSGLRSLLFDDGYFVPQEQGPELVVVGADFEVTYAKLRAACLAIRAGSRFIGTNPDRTFPSEQGLIPGAGSLLAALVASTDMEPFVIGKPQPTMFLAAMELLGGQPGATLVLGDRLDTDIAGGVAAGLRTALVLTGVSSRAEAEGGSIAPDLIVADLPELVARWDALQRT